ncbi:MAG: phosphatidylserine decarboxylase [Pseudomonadota bacterium]
MIPVITKSNISRATGPTRFFLPACLAVILLLTSCGGETGDNGRAGKRAAIVQQLADVIESDPELRNAVEEVLAGQEASSFWYNKTVEDLYDFLDQWLVFQPTPGDARYYMDAFYEFTASSAGRAVVLKESFKNWLHEFMLARGRFMDSRDSAGTIEKWLADPEVKIEDYIIPEGGFASFNDFFTRRIIPEKRPIAFPDDPSILISPADSTAMNIADGLTADAAIEVKGDRLSVERLLGGNPLAQAFLKGKAVLFMLNTTNYHHFHSPVKGEIVAAQQLAGLYYGMTGGWVDYFFEHRRGYFIFDTEEYGLVGLVSVGMFTISSIEFIRAEGDLVDKGDELGHFAYGGSAVILLFEPGRASFSIPIDQGPVKVLLGREIGSAVAPE